MQQSNASALNVNNLGGGSQFKQTVEQMLSLINTGELVKVTAVNASGLASVGFVSVQPLTTRMDADNNKVEQSEIHNVPYFRLQGGTNAIVCDPAVGDIGFCGFCSRDISLVKRIRDMAGTNVYRISDISDAVFFGGWSANIPEQYIWFDGDEIKIKATAKVTIDAPLTHCTGDFTAAGTIKDLSTSSGKTMDSMRTAYNSHNHTEQGDGNPTTGPNTQM